MKELVIIRLEEHMETHSYDSMHDPMYSAYKRALSTETALVRISNDSLQATDNNCYKCMVLASLDLSTAFDTVDHGTFEGHE